MFRISLVALFLFTGQTVQAMNVHVFGQEWALPDTCKLMAKASVTGGGIRVQCSEGPSNLSTVSIRERPSGLGDRIEDASVSGQFKRFQSAELSVFDWRPDLSASCGNESACSVFHGFARTLCDSNVCVFVNADSKEVLNQLTDALLRSAPDER